ncbi:MAG: DUF2062 domain-containing protein [Nitrospinae bacterium]|nr:DUF2062 domain-containing protein [Nitrospinota bacterium]
MKKKFKEILHTILHGNGTPHDVAFASALGIFIAFFPIIGTHTVLALALAWVFRVSPVITLGASWVNNPWTIAPICGATLYLGVLVTGADISEVTINWGSLHWEAFLQIIKIIGVPFVVGGLLAGAVLSVATYFIVLRAVKVYRSRITAPTQ